MNFSSIYNCTGEVMLYSSLGGLILVVLLILYIEPFLRHVCHMFARLLYKIRIHGSEHIPRKGACLIVANHISFIDWLIIMMAARRPVRFVVYHTFTKMPILGAILRMAKAIPIAESKVDSTLLNQAYETISEHLKNGEVVCIFPEGQLSLDGKLSKFKPGIDRIIARDPVPVVPIVIKGLWHTFFSLKTKDLKAKVREIPSQIGNKVLVFIDPAWPSHQVSAKELENYYRKKIEPELEVELEVEKVKV